MFYFLLRLIFEDITPLSLSVYQRGSSVPEFLVRKNIFMFLKLCCDFLKLCCDLSFEKKAACLNCIKINLIKRSVS